MRKLTCIISLFLFIFLGFGQNLSDSLLSVNAKNLSDSIVVKGLLASGHQYIYNNADVSILFYIKALESSEKIKFSEGKAEALIWLGEAFVFNGNHAKAVETSLKGLSEAEKLNSQHWISYAHAKLASIYSELGDHSEAIKHIRKSHVNRSPNLAEYAILGRAYGKLDSLDSALYNAQRAYETAQREKTPWGMPYYTLGEIHTKLGHYTLALEYFRTGLAVKPNALDSTVTQIGIATVFQKLENKDSVYFHAQKAVKMGKDYGFPNLVAEGYRLVKDVYKRNNQLDSAFHYQELMSTTRDTIFAQDKIQQIQNLKFNEQLRQIEIQQTNEERNHIRKRNLQYAAIGIALITFVALFFSLSNTIIVKENFIKFFGVLALLLFFEFINLFAHPFIGNLTHHSPMWMFLIMVCIAALLVPTHHKLEKWIVHQLVEKNKRIRLAAARKTIADLEP